MKVLFAITLTLFFCLKGLSQSEPGRARSVSFEVSTLEELAAFYTFNYDSRFSARQDGFGYHAGIGWASGSESAIFTIPFGINYLVGKGPNYFEGGLGVTYLKVPSIFIDSSGKRSLIAFVPGIAYRYQSTKKQGVCFRIAAAPWLLQGSFYYNLGVSIGYKF